MRPARSSRFAFYAWSARLAPEHDPWVREQLARPSFFLVNVARTLAAGLLPQAVLMSVYRDVLWLPLVLVPAIAATQLLPGARRRFLEGTARRHGLGPQAPRRSPLHPFRRVEVALMVAIVTMVAVGVGKVIERRSCGAVPESTRAAIQAAVGVSDITGQPPAVPRESRLAHLRRVGAGLDGIDYVGAKLLLPDGRFGGVYVWRTIQPHTTLNDSDEVEIDAYESGAEVVTPLLGSTRTTPMPQQVLDAISCASSAD